MKAALLRLHKKPTVLHNLKYLGLVVEAGRIRLPTFLLPVDLVTRTVNTIGGSGCTGSGGSAGRLVKLVQVHDRVILRYDQTRARLRLLLWLFRCAEKIVRRRLGNGRTAMAARRLWLFIHVDRRRRRGGGTLLQR